MNCSKEHDFEICVRIDGEEHIFPSKTLVLKVLRPEVDWTVTTASSYFTPNKIKKWDFPSYLKDKIVYIRRGSVYYDELTANSK